LAFRGQFDYTLDAKKRLNVPAKFRPAFSDGVVLAKALEPCVAIWAPTAFEEWTESFLGNLNPVSKERRSLARYFSGNSWDVELDSAGRVTLSQPLMEYAGIEKEVVVVGNLDHIEVWDRGRWQADQKELDSEIVQIAESLGHPS
jgi:MraZ protein